MKQFQIIKPGTKINFLGYRKRFAILSTVLVSLSVVVLIVRSLVADGALNYGIDFRGGTQIQIDFQQRPGLDGKAIEGALKDLGYKRVSVINVAGEGNAYVIRMENPTLMTQATGATQAKPADGGGKAGAGMGAGEGMGAGAAKATPGDKKPEPKKVKDILDRRFTRSFFRVVLPEKSATKPKEVLATVRQAGEKGARLATPPSAAKRPTVRIMASRVLPAARVKELSDKLAAAHQAEVSHVKENILRRFKPAKSGEKVRMVFTERVTEREIRDAFAEAKVALAPTAGAVARRGRQSRNKIKWEVRLLGLADLLTRQLNDKLRQFVKKAGRRQHLEFALDLPVKREPLLSALQRAGYETGEAFTLQLTLLHQENRHPKDLRKELVESGLTLETGAAPLRSKTNPKQWRVAVAFKKIPDLQALESKLDERKIELQRLALRISERRYQEAVKAAGYGDEDAISLSVTFKMDQAVEAAQLKRKIEEAGLPISKHREAIAQVGDELDYRWLVVLDVQGKDSIIDIERKLIGKVGARGITAIDIPPHGAVKTIESVVRVGSKVGEKLRTDGILSVIYTLAFILLYIGLRFDLKFAPGAVLALAHDVMITVGIWAVAGLEFNLATIAALLTIVGYSLNDTIVVFDRIRENVSRLRDVDFEKVINTSLNETLSRTVLTSITTLLAISAILFLASGDLWSFAIALVIGVLVGTYSSIYIASPFVLWLDSYLARRHGAARATKDSGGGDKGGGPRGRRGYEKRRPKGKDKDRSSTAAEARS
jgi:preprotein translocase SecF subunit